jgi:hypothetical protein
MMLWYDDDDDLSLQKNASIWGRWSLGLFVEFLCELVVHEFMKDLSLFRIVLYYGFA